MPSCRGSTPGVDLVIDETFVPRMSNVNRLGELLVREKLISLQQLRQAQDEQKRTGQNLGYTLAKLGYISDGEITNFLSPQYRVPAVNLDEYEIDAEVLKLVSQRASARSTRSSRSRAPGSSLIVAMADPTNLHAIDDIKFLTGYNVEPVVASETAIAAAVERYYNAGPSYDEVMAGFDETEIEFTGDDEDAQRPRAREGERGRAGRPARATRSCSTPSRRARATSTSSPTRRSSACATASTACSSRR